MYISRFYIFCLQIKDGFYINVAFKVRPSVFLFLFVSKYVYACGKWVLLLTVTYYKHFTQREPVCITIIGQYPTSLRAPSECHLHHWIGALAMPANSYPDSFSLILIFLQDTGIFLEEKLIWEHFEVDASVFCLMCWMYSIRHISNRLYCKGFSNIQIVYSMF